MSTIPKLEEYIIADMKLSIEDYKQKPKADEHHFFANMPHERYHCWVNGGGLGESATPEGARQILFQWAIDRLNEDIITLNEKLFIRLQANRILANDVNNLSKFASPNDKG